MYNVYVSCMNKNFKILKTMKHKKQIIFLIITFVIVSTIVNLRYKTTRDIRNTKGFLDARKVFVQQTNKLWGNADDLLSITDDSNLKFFISNQSISFVEPNYIDLTENQISGLKNQIYNFLKSANVGTFESYMKFRKYGDYSLNTKKLDNDIYIKKDLDFYGMQWPEQPIEKLETFWKLSNIWQANEQYINDYLKNKKSQNKLLPNTDEEYHQLYLDKADEFKKAYKNNPEKFQLARLVSINKKDFLITAHLVTTKESLIKVGGENMKLYPGLQGSTTRIIVYEESMEDILKKENLIFATVSFVSRTTISEAMLPMTIGFYWSQKDLRWLPDQVAKNTLGGFRTML